MENASKALIIAGAILLSILLIGLGMLAYTKANNSVESATNFSTQEATAFNSQFDIYQGEQKGSAVRSLYAAVRSSNNSMSTNGESDKVIELKYTATGLKTIDDIINQKTYKITFGYNSTTGLINKVTIGDV